MKERKENFFYHTKGTSCEHNYILTIMLEYNKSFNTCPQWSQDLKSLLHIHVQCFIINTISHHIISYRQGILTLCKLKVRNKSFSQKWFSKSGSIRYFTKKQLNNNSKFVCLHEKIHCYMRTTRYQQTKTSCTDRKWGRFHTTIRCW